MARKKPAAATLVLPERLGSMQLAEWHKNLSDARGRPIVLNCADLRFIGAQGLQLLISADKTWARDGVDFRVTNLTDEFVAIGSIMGVDVYQLGSGKAGQ